MTFPTSNFLADELIEAQRLAKAVKQRSQTIRTRSQSEAVEAYRIFDYTKFLSSALVRFNAIKTVPGLSQYARDQYGDQGLDIVSEFTTMVAAIQGVIDWVGVNFPSSGGFVLAGTYTNGAYVDRTFSTTALATFRTEIDSLIATVG